MKTYKEHYKECRKRNRIENGKYDSLYDLTVDTNILDGLSAEDKNRYDFLISEIHKQMCNKIDKNIGCHIAPKHAIRVDSWKDIDELYELLDMIMPVVEKEVFGCSAKVEFIHLYRNVPFKNQPNNEWDDSPYESSWKWHYDDCAREFLKIFINLNTVTSDSGCFKFLLDENGEAQVVTSYNISPSQRHSKSQIYSASRIPPSIVKEKLEKNWTLINAEGPPGSYAICTPNIYHRASCPEPGTVPRDVMFLFLRPSLVKQDKYLSKNTYGYPGWGGVSEKNVKKYPLD